MSSPRSVISSAKWIAICTLLSRVAGMARDMALIQVFGAARVLDAFNYAFQIPNLFRRLFAEGAMSAVFVPVFSSTLEREGPQGAWALLGRTLALLTSVLVAVVVVLELVVLAVWLFVPLPDVARADAAGQPAARALLLALTAIMLPFMITICILALLSSILNVLGSFVPAALAPLVLNVGMIAGILLLGPALSRTRPEVQIFGVALSVLAGGALQLALLVPALRRRRVRVGWRFDPRHPTVRRMLALMAPVVLGQGVLLIGVFLDTQICWLLTHVKGEPATGRLFGLTFAYPLREGALSVLSVVQRLYQFPLGVLAISLAVAALPTFSRLAARGDWAAWSAEVRSSLRLVLFAGLIAGAMMALLAEPIVRLLFEYRRFDSADTGRAARVLACYGAGMWAFCVQHIVLRGYYSVGDVRTPLKISCVLLPLNLLLSFVLVWLEPVREAAFGLSAALTGSLNVIVGLALLERRTGARLVDRSVVTAGVRMLVAAALSVALVWVVRPWVFGSAACSQLVATVGAWVGGGEAGAGASALGLEVARRCIDAGGSLLTGLAAYFAVARILGLQEPGLVLARWAARGPARRTVAAAD